jgi:uncharacterized protein YbcV (DUF1398 family)
MNKAIQETIQQCAEDSYSGRRNFGAIVGSLIEAGVESYYADYRSATTTYYMPDGSTHTATLHAPKLDIPQIFDAKSLQAAIKGAQRNEVKYPEFLERSFSAGCAGYIVWIAGRHVSYFGRRGEVHIEKFPD